MRAAKKTIYLANLAHNLQQFKNRAPQSKCIAVVKANAYGCGASEVYSAFAKADMLAVAAIEEAIELRNAGATQPILLLEGVFSADELQIAKKDNFIPMIATPLQLDWLLQFDGLFAKVFVKLDSNMGRLGFQLDSANAVLEKLQSRYAQSALVLTTHFSSADESATVTAEQIRQFDLFASQYPLCQQSLCNSAGIINHPEAHRHYIRPGIGLYGASPMSNATASDYGLKPVMRLSSEVFSIKSFNKDAPIGYAETYRMPSSGKIAIVAMGYADGYSRHLPSGTPVLINDKRYELVGRVSMDMITVLVDDSVAIGDTVELWGENILIEEISNLAKTIPHHLFTNVTKRPHLVYIP